MADLSRDDIERLLKKKNHSPDLLRGKIMASCFFEPSTRTRLSFETAMRKLGGEVIGFTDEGSTSVKKGETLFDTMKMIGSYADVAVVRHPLEGAARLAKEAAGIPVINAGDGANQHPTQTLVDLYTIRETQGKIDDLHIALAGDLKYGRTIHSLAQALSLYNARLYFVAPEELHLPDPILSTLKKKGIKFSFHRTLEEVIPKLDILYMTRLQKERMANPDVAHPCLLKANMLAKAKENLRILHPLPRVDEIEKAIDETPFAYYFQQAANAVPVRMNILADSLC